MSRSPKSSEACKVTPRQKKWLNSIVSNNIDNIWRQKKFVKNYCMIKRLVLYCTNEYPNK